MPKSYGIRLEFLDIEMSKEEQLAFIASRDESIGRLQSTLDQIVESLRSSELFNNLSMDQLNQSVPLEKIKEFKSILDSITGSQSIGLSSGYFSTLTFGGSSDNHIRGLRVPLDELREFARLLEEIGGLTSSGITMDAKSNIDSIFSSVGLISTSLGTNLKDVEETLDRINSKLRQLPEARRTSPLQQVTRILRRERG